MIIYENDLRQYARLPQCIFNEIFIIIFVLLLVILQKCHQTSGSLVQMLLVNILHKYLPTVGS